MFTDWMKEYVPFLSNIGTFFKILKYYPVLARKINSSVSDFEEDNDLNINEVLDEYLPMFFRTSRTDVKDKIKNLFFNRYAINTENDWHPDVQWHEYESTIVESWLKKL